MRDTSDHPPCTRPDLAWGQITRTTASGSFIEDQLTVLVGGVAASAGRFRLDVIHLDQDAGQS